MTCPNCGGTMLGNGYTVVRHCEQVDVQGIEPDAPPVYCWVVDDAENDRVDRLIGADRE